MSKSCTHHCISFLAALAVLFSVVQVSGNSVKAAPPANDLAVPLAQRPEFTINGAVHNRDGTPLGGVEISPTDC